MKKNNTGKTAIILTVITISYSLIGFFRNSLLAYYFGTSYIVDAYLMAIAIPTVVFGWITNVSTVFTPVYMDVLVIDGKEKAHRFIQVLISDLFLVCSACVLIGLLFGEPIARLVAPGFTGNTLALTVRYLRFSILSLLLMAPISVLMAYLNCCGRYIPSQLSHLVNSFTRTVTVIAGGLFGEEYLIIGVLVCYAIQFIFLLVFTRREGLFMHWSVMITPKIKELCKLMLPVFIGSMISEINTLVDKTFASTLSAGSIAMLNYAMQIRNLLNSVFSSAISTISYPILAKEAAATDIDAFRATMRRFFRPLLLLFVPLTVGAVLLAEPAIAFVYQQGQFTTENAFTTSRLFVLYTLSLLPQVVQGYIMSLFYARKKVKTATLLSAITVVINVTLNFILIQSMQVMGLALATSISVVITAVLCLLFLRKEIGYIGVRDLACLFMKSLLSSAIMGAVVYFVYQGLSVVLHTGKIQLLLALLGSVMIGAGVYGVMLLLLRVDEAKELLLRLKGRFVR